MRKTIFWVLILFCLSSFSKAIGINYVTPTDADGTHFIRNYTYANYSVSSVNPIDTFIHNFNGTNISVFDNSLMIHMHFNNDSSIGENDSIFVSLDKNYQNGTPTNTPQRIFTEKILGKSAYNLTLNNYITVTDRNTLDITTNKVTIAVWMSSCIVPSNDANIAGKLGTGNQYSLGLRNTGKADFTAKDVSIVGSTNLVDCKPHYIFGIYDGSNQYLYIDGLLEASGTLTGAITASGNDLWIGCRPGCTTDTTRSINGMIDELRIWNESIPASVLNVSAKLECDRFRCNMTELRSGNYTYYGYVNDTTGASVTTSLRNYGGGTAGPADTTPPEITYYNVTSDTGCEFWNTNKNRACNTSSLTPTVQFNTSESAWCAIGVSDLNFTNMGNSRGCTGLSSGEGDTSHLCTLTSQDELVYELPFIYVSCRDASNNENRTSTSGPLALNVTNIENSDRNSIELGIRNSLPSGFSVYTDQKMYSRNSANAQAVGTFDKVVKKLSKIWAFNRVGAYENNINMFNITPVLYVLEFANISSAKITNQTELLINATK